MVSYQLLEEVASLTIFRYFRVYVNALMVMIAAVPPSKFPAEPCRSTRHAVVGAVVGIGYHFGSMHKWLNFGGVGTESTEITP